MKVIMRLSIAAVFLAVSLASVSAFAAPADAAPQKAHRAEGEKAKFPMPAAQFKQRIDTRMVKAKQRMEERASKLSADQAKELRAKFDARSAAVNQEVTKAIADGTVTKDEAHAVRKAMGKHGHHGPKGEKRAKK